jgi:hypothetical protein
LVIFRFADIITWFIPPHKNKQNQDKAQQERRKERGKRREERYIMKDEE